MEGPTRFVCSYRMNGHQRTISLLPGVVTLKNARVDPDSRQPYLILVCLARSSADSMGDSILSTVRKAARLAV